MKPSLFLYFLTFIFFSTTIKSQGYLKVSGKQIIDATGKEIILRGMGLGGWMLQEPYMLQLGGVAYAQHDFKKKIQDLIGKANTATFYDAWLKTHCTKTDIDSLAAWGFNSVRLPMHYNLFTLPTEEEPVAGQNTWLQKGFELTDSLLNWCKAAKIYLILDLHAAPGSQGNDAPIADKDTTKPSLWQSEQNQQKTIALWRKLAERYAGEEWIGGYDLLNETNYGFLNPADKNGCADTVNAPLKKLLTQITVAIREVDPHHMIFIEGNCWGNNYKGVLPFEDKNTVISFHKYWNYNDVASIKGFLAIRDQYNVPIWLGESGENSNVWFTEAISLMEQNKIGWAWWPMKKLGINNPLQIKKDSAYQQLLNYWRGNAPKPDAAVAFKGLMQQAENSKIENTVYQKDVVDAMFRQVATTATLPFKAKKISNSAIIYAADYDLGRASYAYHDNDSANYRVATGKNTVWNRGGTYRNDGVDIERCTDTVTNGFAVSHTEAGEWMQYTIDVENAGTFAIAFRTSAPDSTGKIELTVNAAPVSILTVLETGSSQKWTTSTINGVSFKKGTNTIRIKTMAGGFNFNYMQLQQTKKAH